MPILLFILLCLPLASATAQFLIDGETGMTFSGYNDVRIPGSSGTQFSLSDDLDSEPAFFYRVRIGYTFDGGHTVSLLAAPLSVRASGMFDRPVRFQDEIFAADTPVEGTYVFNSYRLSYRYDIVSSETLTLSAGVTAKLRDASIQLTGNGRSSRKSNIGVVPLLRFYLDWRPLQQWGVLMEGDALASGQGRAEDVFLGLYFYEDRFLRIKAGYRVLEGGADNDEVYNFALLHYAAVGAVVRF